jgi:hypothetical protein
VANRYFPEDYELYLQQYLEKFKERDQQITAALAADIEPMITTKMESEQEKRSDLGNIYDRPGF